jgi:hypothetical protein
MTPDPRTAQARAYLAEVSCTPVDHLPPLRLIAECRQSRAHLAAVLAVISEVDASGPFPERPMDTSDIDIETGEAFGVDPAADESQQLDGQRS